MFSVFLCCILCLKDGWNDNLPVNTKQPSSAHCQKQLKQKKLSKQLKGPERNVFSRPESPESASCTIEVECWIQNRKIRPGLPLFDSNLERASAFNRLAFGVVVEVDEGHHDLGKIPREWGSERFSSLVSYFCRHLGLKIVSGNLNLKIIKWAPPSVYLLEFCSWFYDREAQSKENWPNEASAPPPSEWRPPPRHGEIRESGWWTHLCNISGQQGDGIIMIIQHHL